MGSILSFLGPLQSALQVVALLTAAYALYELVVDRDWRRRPIQTLGRVSVVTLCGAIGVVGLFLGQNAVLAFADRIGAPVFPTQVAFVALLLLSMLAWTKD